MKKNITTITVALATLFFLNSSVNAQSKETPGDSKATRLGVGFNIGLPTDDAYNLAIGGDLRLQADFTSNVSGILTAGYTNYSVKATDANLGYVPVKAGIKVFPVERFYLSGEIGAAFGTDNQGTAFVFAPGIGVGTNTGIDFGLRYEGMSKSNGFNNPNQVALRIAYGFNLSK